MIVTNPFAAEGRWFKGNLHTHTTESTIRLGHVDGMLTPREMVSRYREAGYDFLAITDHLGITPTEGLGDKGFLVLRGEEVFAERYELVALNIRETIGKRGEEDPGKVLNAIRAQGGIAYLPHPRGFDPATCGHLLRDEGLLNGIFGIEIYNASMELAFGKGEACQVWDEVLEMGRVVHGVAADDAHWHFNEHRPHDVARAFVMVRAKELSAEGVVDALAGGRFYSSTGLVIEDVRVGATEVTVECAGARTITTITNGVRGERWTLLEKPISPARFDVHPKARYLRVECEDGRGRQAWTNVVLRREGP
ncbi:MAG: CehA/McbA family metallohydrolase [Planctomycetota bacterium]